MNSQVASSKYDEYDCSGDGPRPPVPGGESKAVKMTEGYSHVLSTNDGGGGGGSAQSSSMASHMRWTQSLSYLLNDREGLALLKRYVEQQGGIHADRLKFYLACEGLADVREADKIKKMVDAIYRFLKKSQITTAQELANIKAQRRNEGEPRSDIFNKMQEEVRKKMEQTIFNSFLHSDIYVEYIQTMTSTNGSSSSSNSQGQGAVGGYGPQPVAGPPQLVLSSSSNSSSLSLAAPMAPSPGSSSNEPLMMLPPEAPTLITNSAVAANSIAIGTALGADHLTRSLTLPTLHEDSELDCDNIVSLSVSQFPGATGTIGRGGRGVAVADQGLMRLSKDSLLATETWRLREVRPSGAHGYSSFQNNNYESYNTVSLQDSERQSYSSGLTDTETESISTSTDGRPHIPRKSSSREHRAMRQSAMANKEPDVVTRALIPRTQRMHNADALKPLKPKDFVEKLFPKLEEIIREQDSDELLSKRIHDDEEDILGNHMRRVWKDKTPKQSPGTQSPGIPASVRNRRTFEYVLSNYGPGAAMGMSSSLGMEQQQQKYGGDGGSSNNSIISGGGQSQQMRHSRSMPMEQQQQAGSSRKTLSNKWPSMQTDSGISLFSGDTLIKKDQSSSRKHMMGGDGGPMTTAMLEEARRRLEDGRSRSRHGAPLPPPPPSDEWTTVVLTFCDEPLPYRTKVPGRQPTLKQFKEILPKKGSFRFFFKTLCEDLDNVAIQEEVTGDSDILPLFEHKVIATAVFKPSD